MTKDDVIITGLLCILDVLYSIYTEYTKYDTEEEIDYLAKNYIDSTRKLLREELKK